MNHTTANKIDINHENQRKSKSLKTADLILIDFQYQSINCY